MERRIIFGIVLIVGIVIAISLVAWDYNRSILLPSTNQSDQRIQVSAGYPDQVLGGLSHTMALEKNLPNNVEKIMVYKSVPSHYTHQDILSLAQKFNITPIGKIKESAEGSSIASEDGKIYAILHNSGFIEYTNSNRADTVNPFDVPGNLPSDDEAVKIATKFLKDRDLLPEGASVIGTDHGKIYRATENRTNPVIWEDVQVWYGRNISGHNVEGTQLMLAIGGRGDPIEFFTNWRNYQPYEELPVKTPYQAFEELKTKGVSVGMNTPGKVSINNMYLAYHTKAGADTEEYLEPIWMFKGNVIVNGNSTIPVEQYIPALAVDGEPIATPGVTLTPKNISVTAITTSSISVTPIATIPVNETATSPVPTDTVLIIPTASLNVTPGMTSDNSTTN